MLTKEEIRLYILLLISAREGNVIEIIDLNDIRKVNGKGFFSSDIKKMMASLSKYGLADLEGIEGNLLKYRLRNIRVKGAK